MKAFEDITINRRRERLEPEWKKLLASDDCVLVFSGEPITKPGGLDQQYGFMPHPSYFWLSGYRRHNGITFFSKDHGWIDFIQPVTKDESIWEGMAPFSFNGKDVATINEFLRQNKFKNVIALGEPTLKQVDLTLTKDSDLFFKVKEKFDQTRRLKDPDEVKLVRSLAEMANAGYEKVKLFLRPGVTEREIQIEYEAEVFRSGAHGMPYDTIVGSGTNAAVLHAIPTYKKVQDGELVLIDAGAQINDYCVDITRVYPVNGIFSTQQQALYDLVVKAQTRGIAKCVVGTPWNQVHTETARVIAEGLVTLNVMKGSVEAILESGAISMFYPHGVGHLVGLRVRDTGHEENKTPRLYNGARLRVDLVLQENILITVEPGCYFIKTLLNDPANREKYKDFINFNEVEKWINVGGVRIEDDILITKNTPANLTAVVPK